MQFHISALSILNSVYRLWGGIQMISHSMAWLRRLCLIYEVFLVTMMKVEELGGNMLVACLQPKVLELLSKMKIDPYPPAWACKTVAEAVSKLAEVG